MAGPARRVVGRVGSAGLVVAQVALAFVLLDWRRPAADQLPPAARRRSGLRRAEHVVTGRVSPLAPRYPDDAALRSYARRALDRMRALPGVEAAGATTFLPFSWDASSSVIIPEGYVQGAGRIGGVAQSAATSRTAISKRCTYR